MIQGSLFDPVTGFIIVWLFVGAGIAGLMHLVGYKSLKAIGMAYAFALLPAMYVAMILAS